jgi:hypothetical protein
MAATETITAPQDVAEVLNRKYSPPPKIKHDDVKISYDRVVETYKRIWLQRKHMEVPVFAADADPSEVIKALKRG